MPVEQSTHWPQPEPSPTTGPMGGGGIGQLPLAAMLWQLHEQKQSLLIYAAGGSIFLEHGEITHACSGQLEGAPALAQMLSQRSPTVRTAPLTTSPRSISEPLRCLLDRAMSLVTGSVPLPVPEARPGGLVRRDTPPTERLRSVSYASMHLSELSGTPTSITQITTTGTTSEETSSQSYIVGSGEEEPLPVVLRPNEGARRPGAVLVPVILSVVATLGVTLGLLYLIWPPEDLPAVVVDQPALPISPRKVAASATLAASAWEEPASRRTVLVRTEPEGLRLVDALSARPVGVSPLEVELGGNRLTWKLAAELDGHISPALVLPEEGQLASFDLTSWSATVRQQLEEQAVARARETKARRRARRRRRAGRSNRNSRPTAATSLDRASLGRASPGGASPGRGALGGAADDMPSLGLVDDEDLPSLGTVD